LPGKFSVMDAILISSKNKSDLDLIQKLVKKMGLQSKFLSDEEKEDFGLLQAMLEVDRTDKVSKTDVINKIMKKCK
jgi:hypothetical protein